MLLNIETNGATNIVINVPSDRVGYAQDLINIFEKNAVFVNKGYSEVKIVEPTQTLLLGEAIKFVVDSYSGSSMELEVVGQGDCGLSDPLVATPEVFVSIAETTKKNREELDKSKKECEFLKLQVENLKEEISSLTQEN